MEYYCHAGGAVYGCSIPVVGGVEGMEEEEDGKGGDYGDGKWGFWECGGGGGGGGDDTVGCIEDEVDVGEGKGEGGGAAGEDIEGEWTEGFFCGFGPEDFVD